MTRAALARAAALALGLAALSGCAAVSSISAASRALDTYELAPPAGGGGPARGAILQVEVPTAAGSLATDRIVIRPGPLQVAYLPDARWVDPAPEHVQSLLIRTLGGTGRFGFVGGTGSGPLPDYVLMGDLAAFQAEVDRTPDGPPVRVVLRLDLTVMRDLDRRVVASRSFAREVGAASDDALTVVAAFDQGMDAILREAAAWVVSVTRGGAGV